MNGMKIINIKWVMNVEIVWKDFKIVSKTFHCFYLKSKYNYIIEDEEVFSRLLHFCFIKNDRRIKQWKEKLN